MTDPLGIVSFPGSYLAKPSRLRSEDVSQILPFKAFYSVLAPLLSGEFHELKYWYASIEYDCKEEGWDKQKQKCEEKIKDYMAWYKKLREDERSEKAESESKEGKKLKDMGYN